jgi:glutaredoxin
MQRGEAFGLALVMALALLFGAWLRSGQAPADETQTAQLRAQLQPGQLQMISSTSCGYCTQARLWLTEQKIPFEECFVETDGDCRQRWQQTGARATPTFVLKGQAVLGLDVPRFLQLLGT